MPSGAEEQNKEESPCNENSSPMQDWGVVLGGLEHPCDLVILDAVALLGQFSASI